MSKTANKHLKPYIALFCFLLSIVAPFSSKATTITNNFYTVGLWNTGVDQNGIARPNNSPEMHWLDNGSSSAQYVYGSYGSIAACDNWGYGYNWSLYFSLTSAQLATLPNLITISVQGYSGSPNQTTSVLVNNSNLGTVYLDNNRMYSFLIPKTLLVVGGNTILLPRWSNYTWLQTILVLFSYVPVTNYPPQITLQRPNNGVNIPAGNTTVTGTASNLDGDAVTVAVYTNGIFAANATVANGTFSATINLTPGTYTVAAVASSDTYNISSVTNTCYVYTAPDSIILSPPSSSYTNISSLTLTTTASFSGSSVTYVTYDGSTPINTNTTGIFTWSSPTLTSHSVWVKVTDSYGLTGQSQTNTYTFITNNPPTISLLTPTNGFSGLTMTPVFITGQATNGDGHAVTVTIFANNTALTNTMTTNGRYTNNASFGSGTIQIYAQAVSDGFIVYSSTNTITVATDRFPASFTADFATTQGNNYWKYGYYTNNVYTLLAYNSISGDWTPGGKTNGAGGIWNLVASSLFHPSQGGVIDQPTSIRWTAPSTATYRLLAQFTRGNGNSGFGNGVIVYIKTNSTSLWSTTITSSDYTLHGYTNEVQLQAGAYVEFLVDANGNDGSDGTTINQIKINIDHPPTIALTYPASNVTNAPGTYLLQATASDIDGDPVTVKFYDSGTLLATVTNSPYQYSMTPSAGTHAIYAIASSTVLSTASATNLLVIDPFSIAWRYPDSTNTQFSLENLQITASSATAQQVNYYDNGNYLGNSTAPTNFLLTITNATAGWHTYTATATDTIGFACEPITNQVYIIPDTLQVAWLAPTNPVSQFTTNSLQVSVTGNPITQVVYTNNGDYVGTGTTASNNYAVSFVATTQGTNTFTATATDIYGVTSSATNYLLVQPVNFSISWVSPNCPQVLLPSTQQLQINPTGDPLSTVQYYLDGNACGTTITNLSAGPHTLVAQATSRNGLQAYATNTFSASEVASWSQICRNNGTEQVLPRDTSYTAQAHYRATASSGFMLQPSAVGSIPVSQIQLTILGDPHGCSTAIISNQPVVLLSTNECTLIVQASAGCSSAATYYFELKGPTCSACDCKGPGVTKVGNNSVDVKISLGTSAFDNDAGYLQIKQSGPTASLGTPATLMYNFIRPDVQAFTDGSGNLSQIKTHDGLFTVTTIDPNTYTVSFYPSSQVVYTNGSYGATGYPNRIITLGNVGGYTTHFQVNDSDKGIIADYYWLGQGWNLVTGNGLRQENRQEVDTGNQQAITRQILDAQGNLIHQTYEVWQWLPTGNQLVLQVTGTGVTAQTNSYSYDSNGMLIQENHADGSWAMYTYNAQQRMIAKYAPFLNSSPSTNATSGRMETYSYDPANVAGSGDAGTLYPNSPRLTVNYIQGQEVSRSYSAYAANQRVDVQCPTPGAAWNASGNLTTTTYYATDIDHYGQTAQEVHPDGTVDTYTWSQGNGTNYNLEVHKSGAVSGGSFYMGTEEDTFTDPTTGRTASRLVGDIASGLVTEQEVYTYDTAGHVINTVHLDGTQDSASYDCCHKLNSTDRTGLITTYGYDALDRVTSTTRDGITSSNVLDAVGNTLATFRVGTDGTTITTSQSGYDTGDQLLWSTDALGTTTTYTNYTDTSGQAIKSTATLGVTKTDTYASDGSLLSETGNFGPQTANSYGIDTSGGLAQSYTQSTKLDTNGNPTTEWVKTYQDGAGHTTKVVAADGATATSSYNAAGQLAAQTDPDGVVTLYQYNPLGQVEYQAVDINQNGSIDLSGPDRVVQTESSVGTLNGHTVKLNQTYVYAGDNSSIATLINMSAQAVDVHASWSYAGHGTNLTVTSYTGNGGTTTVTTKADGTTATTTAQAGRTLSTVIADAAGTMQNQTYSYDVFNRVSAVTGARNGATSYTYDNADRVTSTTTPPPAPGSAGLTTTSVYDAFNHVIQQQLPDGSWKTNVYNLDGTLQMAMGSQTYPQAYTYDYADRIKTLTTWGQAGAATTTWNYNNRGLLDSKQYADGNGPSYTYTPGGRLATKMAARGITTTYSYNSGGSLSGVAYSDGEPGVTLGYNRLGLVNTADGNISSSLSYNAFGQLLEEDLTGTDYSSQVQYGYDSLNRLQTITSPTLGSTSTIGYTGSRISYVAGNGLTAQYGYVNNSPLLAGVIVSGSGGTVSASSRQYDNLNRLQSLQTSPSTFGVAYSYNALNQRTARTNSFDNSTWNYGYDTLGQVTAANKTIGNQLAAGQQFGYAYDTTGNRINSTFGGDSTGANQRQVNYTANALNQYTQRSYPGYVEVNGFANPNDALSVGGNSPAWQGDTFWQELGFDTSWSAIQTNVDIFDISDTTTNYTGYSVLLPKNPETLTYDSDGNLTRDSQWSYTWDAENRLLSVQSQSTTASYTYDRQCRRITKTVIQNGSLIVAKQYYYDGWNLVAEHDNATGITIKYNWGTDISLTMRSAGGIGGLISMTLNGSQMDGTYTYQYDGNGNVTGLVDHNGKLVAQYDYDPFGEALTASGPLAQLNSFRFSTKPFDSETGNYYFGYRYYRPQSGQWLSRDPIGENGGIALYGYVQNAGIAQVDSLGLKNIRQVFVVPLILPSALTPEMDEAEKNLSEFSGTWEKFEKLSSIIEANPGLVLKDVEDAAAHGVVALIHGVAYPDMEWVSKNLKQLNDQWDGQFSGVVLYTQVRYTEDQTFCYLFTRTVKQETAWRQYTNTGYIGIFPDIDQAILAIPRAITEQLTIFNQTHENYK